MICVAIVYVITVIVVIVLIILIITFLVTTSHGFGNRTNDISMEEGEFQMVYGRNDSSQNMSRTPSPDPVATTTDVVSTSTSGLMPYQVEVSFILVVTQLTLNGILMVMGLISNTISFIVWLQPSTRKLTISPAVLILAIFDTIVLWNDSSYYWFSGVFGKPLPGPSTRCNIRNYVHLVTSCSAAWLLVVTTGSRLSAIWKPARVRSLHSRKTVAIVSVAIVLILCLINTPVLSTYDPITCQVVASMTSYARYLLPIQFLIVHVILPDGLLIIGNIFLVVLFRKHRCLAFKRHWKISEEHREFSQAASTTAGVILPDRVQNSNELIELKTNRTESPEYSTHHFAQLSAKPSTSTQLETQSEAPVEPFTYNRRLNCEVLCDNIYVEHNAPNVAKPDDCESERGIGDSTEDDKSMGEESERRLEGRHNNRDVTRNDENERGSQRMSSEEMSDDLESITENETDKGDGVRNAINGPLGEKREVQHDHGGHHDEHNFQRGTTKGPVQCCHNMALQGPQNNQERKQPTFNSVKHKMRPTQLYVRVTKFAVTISGIHLCLTAPFIIMLSYSNFKGAFLWGEIGILFLGIHESALLLLYLNCTVNFFVYLAYIPPFKQELRRVGRKCCALMRKNSVYPSGQGNGV